MPRTFLAPPGWPAPPAGWTPPVDWQPDPSWPPAPGDWVWWADDEPAVDRSAYLQTVGAAAFAPVHDAPTYAPGFRPGGHQPAFPPAGLQQGGFQPSSAPAHARGALPGFQPSSAPAHAGGALPSFLDIADHLRAEARRRMGFGAVWLLGGIGVSVAATALLDGALYFWGAALYGIVQVLRGLVAYGRADKNALARSAALAIR